MQMCNNALKRRINGWARVLAAWRQDAEAYPPVRLLVRLHDHSFLDRWYISNEFPVLRTL